MIWMHLYNNGHWQLAEDCEHECPLTRACMFLMSGELAQALLRGEAR